MRIFVLRLAFIVALCATSVPLSAEAAANCSGSGQAAEDTLLVTWECTTDPVVDAGASQAAETAVSYVDYRWTSVCAGEVPEPMTATTADCEVGVTCQPGDLPQRLWGQFADGTWQSIGVICVGPDEALPGQAPPRITPALVLRAIERIGLPTARFRTQPAGKTLVNFDTILYTDDQTFTRTLTLLGRQVEVEATPIRYLWHHGDGTTTTSSHPGAPYPRHTLTYRYRDSHVTVRPYLEVTWTARYRGADGPWQTIPDTLTIAGPTSRLRIAEAVPTLTGNH